MEINQRHLALLDRFLGHMRAEVKSEVSSKYEDEDACMYLGRRSKQQVIDDETDEIVGEILEVFADKLVKEYFYNQWKSKNGVCDGSKG